jgi:hypothetical protein
MRHSRRFSKHKSREMEGFDFTETASAGILMPGLQYVNQYRERRRGIFKRFFEEAHELQRLIQ